MCCSGIAFVFSKPNCGYAKGPFGKDARKLRLYSSDKVPGRPKSEGSWKGFSTIKSHEGHYAQFSTVLSATKLSRILMNSHKIVIKCSALSFSNCHLMTLCGKNSFTKNPEDPDLPRTSLIMEFFRGRPRGRQLYLSKCSLKSCHPVGGTPSGTA